MIDQLVSGLPQASQQVNANARDRGQSSPDKEEAAASFEDIVSKAGQKQGRDEKPEGARVDRPAPDALEGKTAPDALRKVSFDLTVALRALGNAVQNQGKTVNAKDVAKAALDEAAKVDRQSDSTLTKLADKLRQAAKQTEQLAQKLQAAAESGVSGEDMAASPADELEALLGLVQTKEAGAKTHRKNDRDDAPETKDEATQLNVADKAVSTVETTRSDRAMMATEIRTPDREAPASDDPVQNDVVRLVSANGRGRSVDIDVPAGAGAAKDGAKSATPKVETATVLEARRYLGFTPESNSTALTTAIKADPTWTQALQSAQAVSDVRTLGNTVTEVNTLKLQLNPENLGSMVASLKLKGEELTVELRVTSVEAYQQLSADHDDIVKGLQDQGFSIDKVTVQLNAADRTGTGADSDLARQQGQAQRDGQAEERDARRTRDDRPEQQQRGGSQAQADGKASGDRRPEPGGSGNIYL